MKDTLYMACKECRLAWLKLFRSAGAYKFFNWLLPDPNSPKVMGGYQPKTNIKTNPPL